MRLMMPALFSGVTISLVFAYIRMNVVTADILLKILLMAFSLTMTFFMLDMRERRLMKKYVKIG